MKLYDEVKVMWDWIEKIKGFAKLESADSMKKALLRECFLIIEKPGDFFKRILSFSSTATKNIAVTELHFIQDKFSLVDILRYIHENMNLLNESNIINILMMISDVSIYEVYKIVHKELKSGFFKQLNECIILDSMKIKPDHSIDVPAKLKEVSEKAEMNIEMLDMQAIWAIAMLNYKTHVYRTAISFFKRFLVLSENENVPETKRKKIHARIYIGYCNEKENNLNGFIEAIRIFEELLSEIESNQEYEELVTELHHGLGHFYNEKAIFGRSETECEDIVNARKHMRKALEKKGDYYSCYGSLFHEYGDYESAERIFRDAMDEETIQNNEELVKEMSFYIGQTGSALNSQNENNFTVFEEYCERTFNFDGIVHARIFKIRAKLRQVSFGQNNISERKKIRDQLHKWYEELTEYTLSSYASAAIKEEYQKTICILKTFQSIYADDRFVWHIEDVQYNLHSFIAQMPQYACELAISSKVLKKHTTISSNLYCMQLGRLWVWCVGGLELKSLIKERGICFVERLDDVGSIQVYPVKDKEGAHRYIQGNGKPDLVVLIPPVQEDSDFEREVSSIMNIVSESYFVFSHETSVYYNNAWLGNVTRGRRPIQYCTDTVNEALKFAYCFRALEILRKELLQPIPLFSLAPTHFSSSYNFQLGEDIPVQFNYLEQNVNEEAQREIRDKLRYVNAKYSSDLLERHSVKEAAELMDTLCCKDEGFFAACFPHPQEDIGQEENYISYQIHDQDAFSMEVFPHKIVNGEVYTIKALSTYKDLFWKLYKLINQYESECNIEIKDECVAHYETLLTDNSEISICCKDLLGMIFSDKTEVLEYRYKCILRKIEGNGTELDYIYLVLLSNSSQKQVERQMKDYRKGDMKMKPTVFVTYAWKPQGTEFEKYQREVLDFTNLLRDHGYDATFDLATGKNNWTQIMNAGLQRDKIIVLLSPEYKSKADKTVGTGVAIERNAIARRLKAEDGSVIFAKLPSQKGKKSEEVLPIIFSGENVIDLSKGDSFISDGYNMLYAKLDGVAVAELHPIGTAQKNIRKL